MAAAWTVSVDERHGLPILTKGGTNALSSAFVFWNKDWKWAELESRLEVVAPFQYSVKSLNRNLRFGMTGTISRSSATRLVWEQQMEADAATPEAIGGGISFRFDLEAFGTEMGEPQLLPENRGWTWGRPGATRIEMRFEPALASVHFERQNKSEIRAFFYAQGIPEGRRRYVATLNVVGDAAVGPTISERFGPEPRDAWHAGVIDWQKSPVDLAFLNAGERPAGKRGFLRRQGDRLVFEDGTQARFWGTNLSAYALFRTTAESARLQARRLSELGFNLVRLHHHDSPWVEPNIFGERKAPDTQRLDPAALEKLDWWIKCLKDEGIYVWLDLHAQRSLKPGDGVEGFDEIAKGRPLADLKGFNYVNASIQQAMKRFNEAYLNHRNRYTGLRYADEPAIVAVLLTNENDLTGHYGNALLPNKGVPQHSARFLRLAEAFASEHRLPKDAVGRTWEAGPAKLFLNDLEQRFNSDMIAHLRAQGARVPIATTSQWGKNPLSSLPALTSGDIVDAHSYGGIGELEINPRYAPNMMHWIASAHVAGRPLTVSEWNVAPFPAPDRHSTPLLMAATARLQGWAAVMQYAYGQDPFSGTARAFNWNAFNDPALLATLPAAALLFRRGDAREASRVYAFSPSRQQLFYQRLSPKNAVALRTAAELGKLVIVLPNVAELPWLKSGAPPAGAVIITDPNQPLIPPDAAEIASSTGELKRNWNLGTYTIDTPNTQAATGWIGGKVIRLMDAEVAIGTRNATVAVQSLDGNAIRESRTLMISLGARSVPQAANQQPFYSEPVEGQLSIRAPRGLTLRARMPAGEDREVSNVSYKNGRYVVTLDRSLRSYWLTLK